MSADGKIRIGISSCLLGAEVRYDGGHKRDAYINGTLSKYFEFVPVCPEVGESGDYDLTVHAFGGKASDATALAIQHGPFPLGVPAGDFTRGPDPRVAINAETGGAQTLLSWAAAAASWQTATIRPHNPVGGGPQLARGPYYGTALAIWPRTQAHATEPGDPELQSISIWGR